MDMQRSTIIVFLTLATGLAGSSPCGIAGERPAFRAELFPLDEVQLLKGEFRDHLESDTKYLSSLSIDRLLHNFRVNAGLRSNAIPLGGWETPNVELRGHFTGHFMSACALAYASTHDETLKKKAEDVVAGLAECQRALGPRGYLSAFPESFFDRLEEGKPVWAPWYTIHKIAAGLYDVYRICGDTVALRVLKGMASWIKERTSRLSDAQMQKMLTVEQGGIGEVLRDLYEVTQDPDHLALARRFDHAAFLVPLSEGRDALNGLHANTNIPKVIGAATEYEVSGDRAARDEATYFWNEIVHKRSYVTGGTSNYEFWHRSPGEMAGQLSSDSHENCCTYNMLKLTEHIFSWTADPRVADYFERALFNGILPTQKPGDGSAIMYYVPMASGLFKMFGDPDSSFWCCTGTGIESFAKLQHGIYFHDSSGVFVNLFVASELTWKEKGFVLRQETSFPDEEGSTLIVRSSPRTKLSLHIRIPYWVAPRAVTVELNGVRLSQQTQPSSYGTITRVWSKGDRVTVHLPMHLRLESPEDDSTLAAIMYGPIVLAGELGTRRMTDEMQRGFETPSVDTALFYNAPVEAPTMAVPGRDVNTWVRPVSGHPLEFRTFQAGKPNDVTLVPFYRLFGQRYAIYWKVMGEKEWGMIGSAGGEWSKGVIDVVRIGDRESEEQHNFQAFRFDTGSTAEGRWVQSDDWLRFDLGVDSSMSDTLKCRFLAEARNCVFDVRLDGHVLASDSVKAGASAEDRSYLLPAGWVTGKERVAVRFVSRDEKPTGRLERISVVSSLRRN